MLHYLLIGIPVILLCLVLQAVLVSACLRVYTRFRSSEPSRNSQLADTMVLSRV